MMAACARGISTWRHAPCMRQAAQGGIRFICQMTSHWRTKRRTHKARASQEGSSGYTFGECIKVMESSRPRVAILENVELIGKPQDSWDRVDDPELSAEPSGVCVPPGAEHKRLGGLCGRRSAGCMLRLGRSGAVCRQLPRHVAVRVPGRRGRVEPCRAPPQDRPKNAGLAKEQLRNQTSQRHPTTCSGPCKSSVSSATRC